MNDMSLLRTGQLAELHGNCMCDKLSVPSSLTDAVVLVAIGNEGDLIHSRLTFLERLASNQWKSYLS